MHRLPLNSDAEHARTIDPLLTEGTPVWIHEDHPSPPLTVIGGRLFSYRDVIYDPIDAPTLKLRAIDDDQVIPFLVRVVLRADVAVSAGASIYLSFPAPPIFNPYIQSLSAWVGSENVRVSTEYSPVSATINIFVPLKAETIEHTRNSGEPITAIIQGQLVLGSYKPLSRGRFTNLGDWSPDPAIAPLSTVESGRDVRDDRERRELEKIARSLASESAPAYDKVRAINSWVSDHLLYEKSAATRSPYEALEDRRGDCDDFTALTAALLRTIGVPARRPTGLLYDFDTLAAHTWVEAALPRRDGDLHWFVIDPTLAGTVRAKHLKTGYVQFRDRIVLYPVRPLIGLKGGTGPRTTDLLFNWRKPAEEPFSQPDDLSRIIDRVIHGVEQEVSLRAGHLVEGGLMLRRESASIAGSPYLVADRPIAEGSTSRLRLRLENEERLVLDLSAGWGRGLESKVDLESIDHIRAAYRAMNDVFFSGVRANFNLELVFIRDPHSDRLHTVTLRFGRYLIEHFLEHILATLKKHHLLTDEEVARMTEIATASGGKNLYILQELARRLPTN